MKVDVKKKESNKTCGLLTHSVLSNLIKRKKKLQIYGLEGEDKTGISKR